MMNETLTNRAGRLRRPKVVLAVALMALVVVLAGCIQIVSTSIPTDIESPPTMTITLDVKATIDSGALRPTIAFRYPSEWTIVSVDYAGDHAGDFLRSSTMGNYFDDVWEFTAPNASHNGHKAGYEWWAGYGEILTLAVDDVMTVTITVQPNRTHGDFLLDFVSGLTDDVSPADPSVNGDGSNWESGGTLDPPAIRLDQPCTLLPSADPSVLSSTPAAGATDVARATDPKVKFSEAMNAATITGATVFVRPLGGAALPASVFYNPTTHEVTIDLDSSLAYDTDYEIAVDQSVQDLIGYHMAADFVASFHTVAEALPPAPTERYPGDGSTDVPLDATPFMAFNQDMNAATINGANFSMKVSGGSTNVPAAVSYDAAERFAYLDPTGDLAPGTTYQVTLTTDVRGTNGLSVAGAPLTWTFTTETPISFLDVPPGHPYHDAILGLAGQGIVSGYAVSGGAEFRPANPVWRAQFAKMIDGALGLDVVEDMPLPPFTDLGLDILVAAPGVDNLYPHEYVAAAYDHGITTGLTPTTFGPYTDISRAQVVTMVVRALQTLHPTLLTPPAAGFTPTWGTSFSSIHGPNARIAEANGLLAGLPLGGAANDPWAPMPRGEVAQVLWNVYEMLP